MKKARFQKWLLLPVVVATLQLVSCGDGKTTTTSTTDTTVSTPPQTEARATTMKATACNPAQPIPPQCSVCTNNSTGCFTEILNRHSIAKGDFTTDTTYAGGYFCPTPALTVYTAMGAAKCADKLVISRYNGVYYFGINPDVTGADEVAGYEVPLFYALKDQGADRYDFYAVTQTVTCPNKDIIFAAIKNNVPLGYYDLSIPPVDLTKEQFEQLKYKNKIQVLPTQATR